VKYFRKHFIVFSLSVFIFLFSIPSTNAHVYEIESYKYHLDIDKYSEDVQQIIMKIERDFYYSFNDVLGYIEILREKNIPDEDLNSYLDFLEIRFQLNMYGIEVILNIGRVDELLLNVDDKYEAKFIYLKAYIYNSAGMHSEAISYFKKLEELSELNQDKIGLITAKLNLLSAYSKLGLEKMVEQYYLDLVKYCHFNNYKIGLVYIHLNLGFILFNDDVETKHEYLNRGWELVQEYDDDLKIQYARTMMRFFLTHNKLDNFDLIYKKVEPLFKSSRNSIHKSNIYTLYASKMSNAGLIDSAIYYNRKALDLRKLLGTSNLVGSSYLNLSKMHLWERDFSKCEKALDSAKKYIFNRDEILYRRLFYNYSLMYYNTIVKKDSIISIQRKIAILNIEVNKKDQGKVQSKLEAAFEYQTTLEEEKHQEIVKAQKYRFWYLIIITTLLFIIVIGLINSYLKKTKNFNLLKIKSYSNRKKLENYKKEVDQLKSIFHNEITGFFILDKDEKISYVNERGESLLTKNSSDILSKPIRSFIADSYHESFSKGIFDMKKFGTNCEVQVLMKSYKELWINFSISPLYLNGELESFFIIALDVSTRVKALEMEKEQRIVLQTLFNSITESIILFDGDGTIKSINDTGSKRLGNLSDFLIGKNYFDILPEAIRNERVAHIKRSVKEKKAVVYSENIDSYNTLVSIFPSFTEDGDVKYIAEFTQDITDRRLAHEQINSLRQKVLRSQMNPHFIFNSLNAIQSYVLKNDTKQAVKYLGSFAKLIRMILDGSRYDYISLNKEISLLEYYLDLQQLRFGDKFSWSLDVDHRIDVESCLIPVMLAQPFIENAIEHGVQQLEGKGSVKISFTKQKEIIVFKVSDNGIGRDASKKIQKDSFKTNDSLSTNIFKERLFTLNKYSGQKITHDIIDLKDIEGNAKGTMVVINIPITFRSNVI